MPLFSLFLFLKFFLFKPPWSKQAPGLSHSQPRSLPRILQQTLRPGRGISCPGPRAGPRDLIVLKHSSYHLIFQCPLSFVSDLHICWNTVGCLLCSSDQLGVSLALRRSGLCSHLSCRPPFYSLCVLLFSFHYFYHFYFISSFVFLFLIFSFPHFISFNCIV